MEKAGTQTFVSSQSTLSISLSLSLSPTPRTKRGHWIINKNYEFLYICIYLIFAPPPTQEVKLYFFLSLFLHHPTPHSLGEDTRACSCTMQHLSPCKSTPTTIVSMPPSTPLDPGIILHLLLFYYPLISPPIVLINRPALRALHTAPLPGGYKPLDNGDPQPPRLFRPGPLPLMTYLLL
jgi:hypothetical protein